MTANLVQYVVPRHRRPLAFAYIRLRSGRFGMTRTGHRFGRRRLWPFSGVARQRGSITSTTITVSFALISLLALTILGFVYLHQVFGTATRGENIQQLELELVKLRDQQKALELEGAELRSLQHVEERIRRLPLVPTDHVSYLTLPPTTVARID